jgi:hypothetical protein
LLFIHDFWNFNVHNEFTKIDLVTLSSQVFLKVQQWPA